MRPKPNKFQKRKVLLWPSRKVYHCAGETELTQRIPYFKVSYSNLGSKLPIYFEGEPIVLN